MKTFKAIVALCFVAVSLASPVPFVENKVEEKDYRLPKGVTPSQYDLILNLDKFDGTAEPTTYTGDVSITIAVADPANLKDIVLHAYHTIEITEKKLWNSKNEEIPTILGDHTFENETMFLTIPLTAALPTNNPTFKLQLKYSNKFTDDMHGFYKSSYDVNGKTHWIAATQFEAVYARMSFPCFDEPALKAEFAVTISIPEAAAANEYSVLSNALGTKSGPKDGFVTYTFEKTKKMSSYLLAYVVSDFAPSDRVTFLTDKWIEAWGRKEYISNNDSDTSQVVGAAVLEYLSTKLNHPYDNPKMQQVAIPDFAAGAMENWGLVTYRERGLLFDKNTMPLSAQQSVVTTVTHELAHQWFGDLVTLHFWDDTWLNEGFADFFEYHASSQIANDKLNTATWDLIGQFVVNEVQGGAFEADALNTSRPLTSPISKPSDMDNVFDDITYSKGGSVLRMWSHVLGDKIFYDALSAYLEDNKFSVGTPELLLLRFSKTYNDAPQPKPVLPENKLPGELFQDWHKSPGYPVLKVVKDGDEGIYNISQERFYVKKFADASDFLWYVPINYATDLTHDFENTAPTAWLSKEKEIQLNLTDEAGNIPSWVVFNVQQTGLYRVYYDEETLGKIIEELINNGYGSDIHPYNRAQLLNDIFSLASSTASDDYPSFLKAFDLSLYLKNETHYIPWKAAANVFTSLNTKLSKEEASYEYFTGYVRDLVDPLYDKLTLEVDEDKDSHTDRLLRVLAASWACQLGNEKCVQAAQSKNTSDPSDIHPDVNSVVTCTIIRNGDQATWDSIWEKLKESKNNGEQVVYLSALGCTKDENIIKGYLNYTINGDETIRKQDYSAVIQGVINGNPGNAQIALDFLTTNLEQIANSYAGINPLGSLLKQLAQKLTTQADVDAMNDLAKTIANSKNDKVKTAFESAQEAAVIIESNVEWLAAKSQDIGAWLKKYRTGDASSIAVNLFLIVSSVMMLLSYY